MQISLQIDSKHRFFLQVIAERGLSEDVVELKLLDRVKPVRLAVSIGVIACRRTE